VFYTDITDMPFQSGDQHLRVFPEAPAKTTEGGILILFHKV
jgi:hypothetical protein